MKRFLLTSALLCVLIGSPSANAYYIREANGTLTTDIPTLTITQTGPEAWLISVPIPVNAVITIPGFLAEPAGEPGLVNHTAFDQSQLRQKILGITWVSDLPDPGNVIVEASPFVTQWTLSQVSDQQFDVTFEDLGDTPPPSNGVPDGGSTLAMLGLVMVGCAGVRKRLTR